MRYSTVLHPLAVGDHHMLGDMDLAADELRVLGSLVEKQLATPQQYPLTLNALTLACSQSSNRDPVVAYDEPTVEAAVTSVKTRGLARFVHPSHGRSVLRYRHALDEALGLEARALAILAVLMLRGPQTPGELRVRTERMVGFSDLPEVQAELDALATRAEPVVVRLARGPGQKEDRYAQVLGAPGAVPGPGVGEDGSRTAPADTEADTEVDGEEAEVDLHGEVAALRAEVGALRRALDDLRAQLGA